MKIHVAIIGLLLFSSAAMAQTTSSNNTLNSTGVTGIQSTIESGYKLSVGGAIKLFEYGSSGLSSPSLYLSNIDGSVGGRCFYLNSDPNGVFRIVDSNASNAVRFAITSSGNVGIGTSSPGQKLEVNGTIKSTGLIVNTGTPASGKFLTSTDANGTVTWTSTLPIANGGTGQTTANEGLNALLPSQSGNSGKVLQSDGTNTSWVTAGGGGSSQWTTIGNDIYNNNSGKVGIGTATPDVQLDINSNSSSGLITSYPLIRAYNSNPSIGDGVSAFNRSAFRVEAGNGTVQGNVLVTYETGGTFPTGLYLRTTTAHPLYFMTANTTRMTVTATGDIGVGITTPSEKFQVVSGGNIRLDAGYVLYRQNGRSRYYNQANNNYCEIYNPSTDGSTQLAIWGGSGEMMRFNEVGGVGIATTNIPAAYKLAVGGNIIAEKVRVKLQSTGWPDYVFADGYDLPTLKETEEFIKDKKHLPGVPSASEIEKEGLDLGDGQAVLLKKIEELTLYMIEMDKKIEQLTAENEKMKMRREKRKN